MKRSPSNEFPGSGAHDRFAADPMAVLDPHSACGRGREQMTTGRPGAHLGSGDKRPPVLRPGCERAAALPSRVGRSLRWPDGRVTDLYGFDMDEARDDAASFCADLMFVFRIDPAELETSSGPAAGRPAQPA